MDGPASFNQCSQLTFHRCVVTKAMEKLHLVTDIPESDTALAVIQSDWARFLPDPTMLDVSLYFARHVYAARRQHRSVQFILDTYKGKAIQSVRERLNNGPEGVTDSVVAAILILTVLDVCPPKPHCTSVSLSASSLTIWTRIARFRQC